jgi:hypothetical protein
LIQEECKVLYEEYERKVELSKKLDIDKRMQIFKKNEEFTG